MKPLIAVTMGDPAGIGPEVIVKALAKGELSNTQLPIIIGSAQVLKQTAQSLGISLDFQAVSIIDKIPQATAAFPVLDPLPQALTITPGKTDAVCGHHSYQYVLKAVELCLQQKVSAMVTAPICKDSWHLAGHSFDGHTGLLAHLTASGRYKMMFAADPFNVILTTTHIPLLNVSANLSIESVYDTILLGSEAMQRLGVPHPKLAVCGLNPHAGENGLFGNEEETVISPAIKKAVEQGFNVSGPYSADTVFLKAVKGEFDLIVAQYHDQGLIPIKLLAFESAVNITVGLPIIRTSVDHGTAFDIAGHGVADHKNLVSAVHCAQRLSNQ